jgi:uncharacterized protein with ATP-grasp and redox domains
MKTYFDCIPCFVRQALDAVRRVTADEVIQEQVLREALHVASEMDLRQSPPAMAQRIHHTIHRLTGVEDPYRDAKDRFNALALRMYPALRARVEQSPDPLETAVRLAIAGNIIDLGVSDRLDESQVYDAVDHALSAPFAGEMDAFVEAVAAAERVLYLADNAGEIVFDRLLLERLPLAKIALVVKGGPILNDATMADAAAAGLTSLLEVIDNGSDAPGTILADCSEDFRRRFDEADLVLAKGQGNYETLSDVAKDVFFALKVKCPVIARDLGCEVGGLVLRRSVPAGAGAVEAGSPVASGAVELDTTTQTAQVETDT